MEIRESAEYACPFCGSWVNLQNFTDHEKTHYELDYRCMSKPESLIQLKERMMAIGMWEER